MKISRKFSVPKATQRGQSLVEVALFFPIFIIMVAGLVEVAQLLVTQNRVTSATRSSTRFAANGGQDAGMTDVLLQTVTQTLNLEPEVWDVWSVRGTINEDGTQIIPDTWEFTHIYGVSNTQYAPNVDEAAIQDEILEELQRNEFGDQDAELAEDLRFVATYAVHDVDSILGLNALPQLQGFTSVRDLAVMRVIGFNLENTDGCDGFPIAVHEGLRSVTQQEYQDRVINAPGNTFYPQPPPEYNLFLNHNPDVPLLNASEGDIFLIQNGLGNGNFGWIAWNQYVNTSAQTLGDSMAWPGDSSNYTTVASGQTPPGFEHPVLGFIEYGDPTDTEMNIDDWLAANTGSTIGQARDQVEEHIDLERTLRLIIWDDYAGQGSNGRYHISGFGIFRLIGHKLSQSGGGESFILAEFIRWDNSCGQVAPGP